MYRKSASCADGDSPMMDWMDWCLQSHLPCTAGAAMCLCMTILPRLSSTAFKPAPSFMHAYLSPCALSRCALGMVQHRPQSVDRTHQYASECSSSSHSTEQWHRRPWEQRARDGRRPYVPISACGRGAPACSWRPWSTGSGHFRHNCALMNRMPCAQHVGPPYNRRVLLSIYCNYYHNIRSHAM